MVLLAIGTIVSAQNDYHITVESKKPAGIIDEMLYGQLFEHIYFSANNGVWRTYPSHEHAHAIGIGSCHERAGERESAMAQAAHREPSCPVGRGADH